MYSELHKFAATRIFFCIFPLFVCIFLPFLLYFTLSFIEASICGQNKDNLHSKGWRKQENGNCSAKIEKQGQVLQMLEIQIWVQNLKVISEDVCGVKEIWPDYWTFQLLSPSFSPSCSKKSTSQVSSTKRQILSSWLLRHLLSKSNLWGPTNLGWTTPICVITYNRMVLFLNRKELHDTASIWSCHHCRWKHLTFVLNFHLFLVTSPPNGAAQSFAHPWNAQVLGEWHDHRRHYQQSVLSLSWGVSSIWLIQLCIWKLQYFTPKVLQLNC